MRSSLPAMVPAQTIQRLGRGAAGEVTRRKQAACRPVGFDVILIRAFSLPDGVALNQVGVMFRGAQENVGEKLAAGEDGDQHLKGVRVSSQLSQQHTAFRDRLEEALQVDQRAGRGWPRPPAPPQDAAAVGSRRQRQP